MKITVVKKDNEQGFNLDQGERILYAGLRQGIGLPHECATGTCGSCKAVLKSGRLEPLWRQAPGAKSVKTERNEFLMCQATAITDCEIGLRAKSEIYRYSGYRPDYYNGRISESELLTRDVIRIKVVFEKPLSFRAGQFVVMSVAAVEGGRAYSMVNPNADGSELEFIVKCLPGGEFSKWLFDTSRLGAPISVFGPLGRATLAPDENRDLVCITGGSGIAGIISLLTQAFEDGYFMRNRGHLFFGVRSWQDLFFHNRLLELCESSQQNLRVSFTFSDGAVPNGDAEKPAGIEYLKGDVTPLAMHNLAADLEHRLAFLAGPPPMVDDAIRRLVMDAGFPASDIRYDKFG